MQKGVKLSRNHYNPISVSCYLKFLFILIRFFITRAQIRAKDGKQQQNDADSAEDPDEYRRPMD